MNSCLYVEVNLRCVGVITVTITYEFYCRKLMLQLQERGMVEEGGNECDEEGDQGSEHSEEEGGEVPNAG